MNTAKNLKGTILILLLSLSLFCLYCWTAPRGTTPEDASEFILVAHKLGLAHPPGYPLFTFLGHLFSFFPWGTPAQKIAWISHLSLALSAAVLGCWVFLRSGDLLWVAFAVLTFGLSPCVWESAQFVEVYPLHTFLMSTLFLQAYLIFQSKEKSFSQTRLFLLGLNLGFGLANHYPLVVLLFPALAYLLFPKRSALMSVRSLVSIVFGIAIGALPYLYLFYAHQYSEFIFSSPIQNVNQFLDYVLRKEYAANDRSRTFSLGEVAQYLGLGLKMLFFNFTPLVFLGALVSIKKSFKESENAPFVRALVLGVLSSFVFLFFFWQPDYYSIAIELFESFQGFALFCFLILSIESGISFFRVKDRPSFAKVLIFFIPLFLFVNSFKSNDRRTDDFSVQYASMILDSLPANAVLFVKGDADAGALGYAHYLEGKRPDVLLISQVAALLPHKPFDRQTDISTNQHRIHLLNTISRYLDAHRPVFSIGSLEYFDSQSHALPFKTVNYGLFQEIYDDYAAPSRDFGALMAQAAQFLDRSLAATYRPNFQSYRERNISDACHALLLSSSEHPAFSLIPKCQILKAQWVHVHNKDYQKADAFFLEAIRGLSLAQNSDLVLVGFDFLINRLKWIDSFPESERERKQLLIKEAIEVTLPIATGLKVCKNKLAPRLLELTLSTKDPKASKELRDTFKDCSWVQALLSKY